MKKSLIIILLINFIFSYKYPVFEFKSESNSLNDHFNLGY
jgi:hypothetical protein